MDMIWVHSVFTLGLLITLVCIYSWAYSKPKQEAFAQAASSIFAEDVDVKDAVNTTVQRIKEDAHE